jgi:hypothetical protein
MLIDQIKHTDVDRPPHYQTTDDEEHSDIERRDMEVDEALLS